jgi:hypothetical protein
MQNGPLQMMGGTISKDFKHDLAFNDKLDHLIAMQEIITNDRF